MRMQNSFDIARTRSRENKIHVDRYEPLSAVRSRKNAPWHAHSSTPARSYDGADDGGNEKGGEGLDPGEFGLAGGLEDELVLAGGKVCVLGGATFVTGEPIGIEALHLEAAEVAAERIEPDGLKDEL